MELFHDTTLKVTTGQVFDVLVLKDGRPNFDLFTMDKYESLIKYKTSYFTPLFPTAAAMYLANLHNLEIYRKFEAISLEIDALFQIQNDYLDCFSDSEKTGKVSNDISEGKCTWLAVVALQLANPQQRSIMEEYYGRSGEAEMIIKNLYRELNLPKLYAKHEETSNLIINTHIEEVSEILPRELFLQTMELIYKKETSFN